MKRREFLKSTLLFAAVSTVAGKAAGLFNSAHAVPAAENKLGYKSVSPKAKDGKTCSTCKHFAGGNCTLPAMVNAMGKPKDGVQVKEGAYCNMWAKKA